MSDMNIAVEKINATSDYDANVSGNRIYIKKYGKSIGYITEEDIDGIGHSATGFGPNLRKGALGVWEALSA